MKQTNRFREDMLDLDDPAAGQDVVYIAGPATAAYTEGGRVDLAVPMFACRAGTFEADPGIPEMEAKLHLEAWGDSILRISVGFDGLPPHEPEEQDTSLWTENSPMIERDPNLTQKALHHRAGSADGEYIISDDEDRVLFRTVAPQPPSHPWSNLQPEPHPVFDAVVCPDGQTEIPFMAHDTFFAAHRE